MTSSLLALVPLFLPLVTQGDDPASRNPALGGTLSVTGKVVFAYDADGDGTFDTWLVDTDKDGDPDIHVFNYSEPDKSELAKPDEKVEFEIEGKPREGAYVVKSWTRFGSIGQRSSGGSSSSGLRIAGKVIEARDTPVQGKVNGKPDSWDIDTNGDGKTDITIQAKPGGEPLFSELIQKGQHVEGTLDKSKSSKKKGYIVKSWNRLGIQ